MQRLRNWGTHYNGSHRRHGRHNGHLSLGMIIFLDECMYGHIYTYIHIQHKNNIKTLDTRQAFHA